MQNKITIYLIAFFSLMTPLREFSIAADNKEVETSNKGDISINIDYFNKFPSNDYILGPGDQILIIVSKDYPELTRRTTIDGEGTISLSTLGRIYVEGLTINELNILIRKAYKEYVKYPDVEISITNYRPIKIFVDGEVNEPGILTLKGSLTVETLQGNTNTVLPEPSLQSQNPPPSISFPEQINRSSFYFPRVFDVIQKSGGVTKYSDLSKIKLIRNNSISSGGGQIVTFLNLEKLILNRDDSHNIRVYDNDLIVVDKLKKPNQNIINSAIKYKINSKYVKVVIAGRVNFPGVITLSRKSTLNDAIDMAGGAKAIRGKIKYISFNNDGSIDKRNVKYSKKLNRGSYSNPYLKQGDLIVVGSNFLSNSAEAINEITSPFQGLYSAYRLIELISD